jgi:hypothetical protein
MNSRKPGVAVALLGAALVLLAYYALPVVTLPFVGSLTAPTFARLAPDTPSLILVPLVPFAAAVAVGVGLWLLATAKPANRRIGVGVLVAAAAVSGLAYLIPLLRLQGELAESGLTGELGVSAVTFTGFGFWAGLVGAVLIGAGGVLELTAARPGISSTARARPPG